MDVEVIPGEISGSLTPPPSKSETHRGLLGMALAGGGVVTDPLESRDTRATAAGIDALGGSVEWSAGTAVVTGFPDGTPIPSTSPIDCANSGTTLRFLTGIAALADGQTTLTGDASLRLRPNTPLLEALEALGATAVSDAEDGTAPITVTGPLDGGSTTISGSVSSQFVSSILLAGSMAPAGVEVTITAPLRSAPYLELTIETLSRVNITVERNGDSLRVPPDQTLHPPASGWAIGVDPTAASYPLVAGVLAGGEPVTVTDVGERAGDLAPIIEVLRAFDVPLTTDGRQVSVTRSTPVPATVDLSRCPDLLPTAAVLASLADGTSHLVNCEHARYKETDRIRVTAAAMRSLGVPVSDRSDGLTVRGRPEGFLAGTVDPHGDHRIAMAAAVAGLVADGPVRIRDADCVDVSYPAFFADLESLGATIHHTVPHDR